MDSILDQIIKKIQNGISLQDTEIALLRLALGRGEVKFASVEAGRDVRDNIIIYGDHNFVLGKSEFNKLERTLSGFSKRMLAETKKVLGVLFICLIIAALLLIPYRLQSAKPQEWLAQYVETAASLALHPKSFFLSVLQNDGLISDVRFGLSFFMITTAIQHLCKLFLSAAPKVVSHLTRSLFWGTLALLAITAVQAAVLSEVFPVISFQSAFVLETYYWTALLTFFTLFLLLTVRILRNALPGVEFVRILDADTDPSLAAEYEGKAREAGERYMAGIGAFSANHFGVVLLILIYKIFPFVIALTYTVASSIALNTFVESFWLGDNPVIFLSGKILIGLQILWIMPLVWIRTFFGLGRSLQW